MSQLRPDAAKDKIKINFFFLKRGKVGNSLAGQWLGLGAFTAEGPASIPGRGTKIPQAVRRRHHTPKKRGRVIFIISLGHNETYSMSSHDRSDQNEPFHENKWEISES